MEITLTIIVPLVMVGLGIWGYNRGITRGMLTLVGTLLSAATVDLWYVAWGDALRKSLRPENTALPIWVAASLVFLFLALVAGYGSGLLLPKQKSPAKPKLQDQVLGGFLGVVNGGLLVGYLLHYADLLRDAAFSRAVQTALPSRLLYAWLPWYLLAIVTLASIWILLQLIFLLGQRSAAPPAAPQLPERAGAKGNPAPGAAKPPPVGTQIMPGQTPPPSAPTPPPPAKPAKSGGLPKFVTSVFQKAPAKPQAEQTKAPAAAAPPPAPVEAPAPVVNTAKESSTAEAKPSDTAQVSEAS